MARQSDKPSLRFMRLVVALEVLVCLLMTWSLGPALPAYADDPEQLPPSSPRPAGLGEIEFHQPRQDPDARLQIIIRRIHVLVDRDLGAGDFRFKVWLYRFNPGCNPAPSLEACLTPLLETLGGLEFQASEGTITLDRSIPSSEVRISADPPIETDHGIPVWADQKYLMEIQGIEMDTFAHEDVGRFLVGLNAEDNWRIGTWKILGTQDADACFDDFPPRCGFHPSVEADTIVEYEVRLAPLPDLTPMKIEKVTLAGTTNDAVCMDVGNVGPVDAGPFQVALRIDDTHAPNGILQAGGLPAGKVATLCTETTLPTAGQHRLSMTVDEPRQVVEQRETNNRGEQTLDLTQAGSTRPQGGPGGPGPVVANDGSGPVNAGPTPTPGPSPTPTPSTARPDLTVSAIKVRGKIPDGKDDCKDGKNDVAVVVKNAGKSDASAFAVQLAVDGEGGQIADKQVSGLDAGEEREVRFEDVRLKKGEQKLAATADAQKSVAEADEANNALSVSAGCKDED